jgi:hypothetical protein
MAWEQFYASVRLSSHSGSVPSSVLDLEEMTLVNHAQIGHPSHSYQASRGLAAFRCTIALLLRTDLNAGFRLFTVWRIKYHPPNASPCTLKHACRDTHPPDSQHKHGDAS